MGSRGLHIEIEAFFNIIGLKNVEFCLNGKHFTWEMGDFTQIGRQGSCPLKLKHFSLTSD